MEGKVEEQRPLLRLNEPVPDFEATTTHGKMKLSDFKGKWVVLFSHPADFTPVCTTEFAAFAKIHEELVKRNVQLIGLSIDSIYSHIDRSNGGPLMTIVNVSKLPPWIYPPSFLLIFVARKKPTLDITKHFFRHLWYIRNEKEA